MSLLVKREREGEREGREREFIVCPLESNLELQRKSQSITKIRYGVGDPELVQNRGF